jgi:hypothetical protein
MAACFAVVLLLSLAGCSTTPEALESGADATGKIYPENYLETYRRLVDNGRRCATGGDTRALSMLVEADLHQDLGFGEVRFVAAGMLYSNYYASAKIEKSGNGSRVSVKVNNPLIGERLSNMILRWAGGDPKC